MTFEATWRMTLDDFRVLTVAYKRRQRSETFIRYADPVFIAAAALGSVYFFWTGDPLLGGVCAGYVVLLIGIRKLLGPWAVRRRFAQQNLGANDLHLLADDDGLSVTSDHADTRLKWTGVSRVDALDGLTIVWTNGIAGVAIPARAFADPDDAAAFATFAKEKANG